MALSEPPESPRSHKLTVGFRVADAERALGCRSPARCSGRSALSLAFSKSPSSGALSAGRQSSREFGMGAGGSDLSDCGDSSDDDDDEECLDGRETCNRGDVGGRGAARAAAAAARRAGRRRIPEPRDPHHYKAMVYARAIINAKLWQAQG